MAAESSGSEPLVTVAVSVYNAGGDLRPSVESVLRQTHRNLEVLIVDDGSTDGCIGTIEDIQDPRAAILRQENLGKSVGLNRVLARARGEFVAIHDADDLSHPTRIEEQVRCLIENPDVAAVFCGHELILDGRRVAPRSAGLDRAACRRRIEAMKMPGHDPTAMYRRSLLEGMEYDPSLRRAQGLDFILRLGEKHPMLVLDRCLYSYRVRRDVGTERAKRWLEQVHEVVVKACRRRGLPPERAREFYQDFGALKKRALDNNLPAHFIESALSLRRMGHSFEAVRTGLVCSSLRPLDLHYHKALIYSLLPQALVRRLRRSG
jgi:glycosyltransferase involved in cell wall biosynthesis